MKKIAFTLLLMLVCVGAWAQYAQNGVLKRAGTHLEMDGERLAPEAQAALLADVGGIDYNAAWEEAGAGRRLGLGLAVGGGIAAVGGLGAATVGLVASAAGAAVGGIAGSIGGQEGAQEGAKAGASAGGPYITGGLIATAAGVAAMCFGIPKLVSSNRKLNGIVDSCNSARQPAQLTLGPAPYGFGLSLRF